MSNRKSTTDEQVPITVRKSPRLLNRKSQPELQNRNLHESYPRNGLDSSEVFESPMLRRSSRLANVGNSDSKSNKSANSISNKFGSGKVLRGVNSTSESKKSPGSNEVVKSVRRSARFSSASKSRTEQPKTLEFHSSEKIVKSAKKITRNTACSGLEELAKEEENGKAEGKRSTRKTRTVSDLLSQSIDKKETQIVCGLAKNKQNHGGLVTVDSNRDIKFAATKKRQREGESSNEWTKEQELALQNAYFKVQPTPHFWKKVAKLVAGKSVQDCFDKVHSDYTTPPQPQPRSRAKKLNSSPIHRFSLSASKLLKPNTLKDKKPSCNVRTSRLARKTIRQLLEKRCHVDNEYEADLFSVLEPESNLSTQVCTNTVLATPLASSSGSKQPLSRFSSSGKAPVVSPPVLKQVKNKALHEKYIEQLHCREAKRVAKSGKENVQAFCVEQKDGVKAAKDALVADVRDAMNKLRVLETESNSSDSEFDDIDKSEESIDF